LQISQMTGSSSTAISDPLAVAPNPSQAKPARYFLRGV
jgi:hypothetical protein